MQIDIEFRNLTKPVYLIQKLVSSQMLNVKIIKGRISETRLDGDKLNWLTIHFLFPIRST